MAASRAATSRAITASRLPTSTQCSSSSLSPRTCARHGRRYLTLRSPSRCRICCAKRYPNCAAKHKLAGFVTSPKDFPAMYRAPLQDIKFALDEVIGTDALAGYAEFAEYSTELADSVLQEAARLAEEVLDPLYASADREGAHWASDGVTTPARFKEAYHQYVAGGWPQLRATQAHGGQGMPTTLVCGVEELFASANLAFRLCPMLTQGATEAIAVCGSPAQQAIFLPRMVRGEWTGTMNLTEPQAGSDLAQVRTHAVPRADHYRIFGQKIFITYGEHDLAENIIHLVLARIEGAPAGVKGISLFIVPKFLVQADGSPGERNDLRSEERRVGK